jgi:hypothetical protein
MGMVMFSNEDLLRSLVYDYFSYTQRAEGSSQKAADIAGAKEDGFRDGMTRGISAVLNMKRLEMYRRDLLQDGPVKERMIPAVESWNIASELRDFRTLYRAASGDVTGTAESRRERMSAVIEAAYEAMLKSVPDEGLDRQREQRRRERILAGEVQPTAEDFDWLNEEHDKLDAAARPLREALAKVNR